MTARAKANTEHIDSLEDGPISVVLRRVHRTLICDEPPDGLSKRKFGSTTDLSLPPACIAWQQQGRGGGDRVSLVLDNKKVARIVPHMDGIVHYTDVCRSRRDPGPTQNCERRRVRGEQLLQVVEGANDEVAEIE